ncbi:hypothetical protein AGMMS4957_09690 [Bacteroidia bacterium]|nr:hypothetical protein AGMMS4957_09690 [Bacteroidia bacterium]
MSKVRFVCLANSFKEGGRCLAGVVLDSNNVPIFDNGVIQWIRPISKSFHGKIDAALVENINLLDILEIDVLEYPNLDSYQSENAIFVEDSIQVIGKYDKNSLAAFYDSNNLIFGNKGKAIHPDNIASHKHSLMFIKTTDFEVFQKKYENNPNSKIRLRFTYKENLYDLPVTDPVFLKKYQTNPDFMKDYNQMDLALSIGVEHEGWYNKLVVGIILSCIDNHNSTIIPLNKI